MELLFKIFGLMSLLSTFLYAFHLTSDTKICQELSSEDVESLQCGEQFLPPQNSDRNASIVKKKKGDFPW